jgi:hypothetical protein
LKTSINRFGGFTVRPERVLVDVFLVGIGDGSVSVVSEQTCVSGGKISRISGALGSGIFTCSTELRCSALLFACFGLEAGFGEAVTICFV